MQQSSVTHTAPKTKLETSAVSVSFGGLRALDNIDISVGESEIRGIIGPNGAGKTTLLNVICGINHPDQGQVLLDGLQITGLKFSQIAKRGWDLARIQSFLFGEAEIAKSPQDIHPIITGGPGVKMTCLPLWAGGTLSVTKPLLSLGS